jgi:hypothetical protein
VLIGRSRTAKPSHALRSSESRSFKRAQGAAAANRSHRSEASRASAASQVDSASTAATLVAARSVVLRDPALSAADGNAGKLLSSICSRSLQRLPFLVWLTCLLRGNYGRLEETCARTA